MNHSRCLLLLALPVLTTPLWAQRPVPPLRVAIQTEMVDGSAEHWACGNAYKVRLGETTTFIPRLGAAAAQNAEFSWHTRGLAGGENGWLPARAGALEHRGFHAELDLGFARECYDVEAQGLEQTFVMVRRPELAGDLLLCGEIRGNLHALDRAAAHAPLAWCDALGDAVVEYGAATAVDARGRQTALDTSVVDGEVRIHLPATLVANAVYPLTIDPLLTPHVIAPGYAGPFEELSAARTPAPVGNPIGIALIARYSAVDADPYLIVCSDDYASIDVPFAIFATTNEDHAALGLGGNGTRWILTFSRSGYNGPCHFHVHDVAATNVSDSTFYPLSHPAGSLETRPCIGGNVTASGNEVLMVREQYSAGATTARIVASRLNVVTLHETAVGTVSSTALFSAAARPTVSRDAANQGWLVAWQRRSTLGGGYRVAIRRVGYDGSLSPMTLASDRGMLPVQELAAHIDGADGRYTLFYGELDLASYPGAVTGDTASSLRSMRIDWATAAGSSTQVSQEVVSHSLRDLRATDVAFDTRTRSHWALSYVNTANDNLMFVATGMTGLPLRSETLHQASSTVHGLTAAMVFDATSWRFRCPYSLSNGSQYDLWIRDEQHPDNPVTAFGIGNCSSALATAPGRFLRGNQFARLGLAGAPSSQLAMAILSLASGSQSLAPQGMPGCNLLVDIGPMYLGAQLMLTDTSGHAELSMALPETLPNLELFVQWAHLAPGANAAGALFTHGLRVPVR